jgi:hypothetical protein
MIYTYQKLNQISQNNPQVRVKVVILLFDLLILIKNNIIKKNNVS